MFNTTIPKYLIQIPKKRHNINDVSHKLYNILKRKELIKDVKLS